MNPSISILVPICNVEKYLGQCIDSIICQTLKDLEIILINDGSKDSSLDIIKSYASKDSRIVVIDKPNSGYGDSMNKGLSIAKGKYVGIVESDDWIEEDMFETLYSEAETHSLDVVRSEFFYYSTVNGTSNVKSKTSFVPHNKILTPRDETSVFLQQPSIWANLYLRSFLQDNDISFLPTPGASYQDTSFSFKVYACATRFKMLDGAFYHYRIDGGSSSFQNTTKVYCICDEYNEIWRYLDVRDLHEQYKSVVSKMQFAGYKWNYNRLASPYSEEFFARWNMEFTQLDNNGDVDKSSFIGLDAKILSDVLSNKPPKKDVPWVSIVVPVYNVEGFLAKCLDSLISQTLTNIEIICVNDGSTDNSSKILSEYASKDNRIIVINKPNGGLSSARNAGMKVAKANYIAFVDSDDWVEPDTYERAFLAMEGVDIVCFGTNVTGEAMMDRRAADTEYYRIKFEGQIEVTDEVKLQVDVAAWNKLYSMKIIRDNNLEYPVGLLYEDYSFYWRYINLCKKAYFIKDCKYNYLRREGSIMANTFNGNKRALEHIMIFPDIYNFIKNNKLDCSDTTLNSMFLNCFWFAYLNVPRNKKKKVMTTGAKTVSSLGLSGDYVIDALAKREFAVVDPNKDYSFKKNWIHNRLRNLEHLVGGDFDTFNKMLFGVYRHSSDSSNSIATTEWVHRHEVEYGVERWAPIYDCNHGDANLNWDSSGGLYGNRSIMIPERVQGVFKQGVELKILVTLWGAEVAILQGPIISDRLILGTAIFDGSQTYAVSVDIDPQENTMVARAINMETKEDYSEFFRILKIESRKYY